MFEILLFIGILSYFKSGVRNNIQYFKFNFFNRNSLKFDDIYFLILI